MLTALVQFLALAAAYREGQRLQALAGDRCIAVRADAILTVFEPGQRLIDTAERLGGHFREGNTTRLLQIRS